MSPFSAASIAPASAVSSHGCATAVGTGQTLAARQHLFVLAGSGCGVSHVASLRGAAACSRTAGPVSFRSNVNTIASATPYSMG